MNKRSIADGASLAIILILTLVTASWLSGFIQQNAAYPSDGDEGLHAYEALRVSAFLREGDWGGALTASVMNWFYPPAHPWLLGATLTLGPATHATMRLFSLALYVLDVWLLYTLGRRLARDTRWPWLGGLAASLPMLMAPPVWIMASLVYIELLGVLLMLLTLWGYWQGVAGREWGWLVAGCGMVATALVKYPYWPFLVVPLLLALVVRDGSNWRALVRHLALMLLPSAVVIVAWVAWPVTRSGLAWYIVATQEVAESVSLSPIDHFIFYLKTIVFHFSPSPLMAAGLAAAFMISALRWRDHQLSPLVFFFAWHLVSASLHGGLRPRFIVTAMPALWLMGGVWVARVAEAWPGWIARLPTEGTKWTARLAMLAVLVALVVTAVVGLDWRVTVYPVLYMAELETDPRAESLYEWTAAQIPAGAMGVGLVNEWDQMSNFALGWELMTRHTAAPRHADLVTMWQMDQLPEPTPESIAVLRDQMDARHINYLVAYTAAGMGSRRLRGVLALMGDQLRLVGEKEFMFRWYWPDEVKRRLYDNEYLDEQELDRLEAGVGRDRVTVSIYAYTP